MFWSMDDAPPIIDFISSGICSVMAEESALAMLFATGSVSLFQVPSVASTHSARDQARPIRPVPGTLSQLPNSAPCVWVSDTALPAASAAQIWLVH